MRATLPIVVAGIAGAAGCFVLFYQRNAAGAVCAAIGTVILLAFVFYQRWERKLSALFHGLTSIYSHSAFRPSAEDCLRRGEERYQILTERLKIGIFLLDSSGRIISVTANGAQMLEYATVELQSMPIADVLFPEDRSRLDDALEQLRAGHSGFGEWRFRRKDNSWGHARVVFSRYTDGIYELAIQDVSPKRQAETVRTLIESLTGKKLTGEQLADRLRLVCRQLAAEFDLQCVLITLKEPRPLGHRILGAGSPEWLDEPAIVAAAENVMMTGAVCELDRQPPDVLQQFRRLGLRDGLALPLTTLDQVIGALSLYARHDGFVKSIDQALFLNMTAHMAVAVRNAMAVESQDVRFHERVHLYHLLFQRFGDALLLVRADHTIAEANAAASRLYGYSHEELLHMKAERLHADNAAGLLDDRIQRALEGTLTFETVHRDKDGLIIPLEITAAGSADEDEVMVLFAARDIRQRRRAEQELMQAVERAERSERMSSLGTLAAGIAHEINQPLNALKLTVDSLLYWQRRGHAFNMDKVVQDLEKISAHAGRMEKIIKHMRSIIRVEHHSHISPCDMSIVARSALEQVGPQLANAGIVVREQLAVQLPLVLGNVNRLEEVAVNLLMNALQSLDRETEQAEKVIDIHTGFRDHKVVLEVADNGPGIPVELRERIFEPFFTTRQSGVGMGIGLSVSHAILAAYGGEIHVGVSDSGGARFQVELPEIDS